MNDLPASLRPDPAHGFVHQLNGPGGDHIDLKKPCFGGFTVDRGFEMIGSDLDPGWPHRRVASLGGPSRAVLAAGHFKTGGGKGQVSVDLTIAPGFDPGANRGFEGSGVGG